MGRGSLWRVSMATRAHDLLEGAKTRDDLGAPILAGVLYQREAEFSFLRARGMGRDPPRGYSGAAAPSTGLPSERRIRKQAFTDWIFKMAEIRVSSDEQSEMCRPTGSRGRARVGSALRSQGTGRAISR